MEINSSWIPNELQLTDKQKWQVSHTTPFKFRDDLKDKKYLFSNYVKQFTSFQNNIDDITLTTNRNRKTDNILFTFVFRFGDASLSAWRVFPCCVHIPSPPLLSSDRSLAVHPVSRHASPAGNPDFSPAPPTAAEYLRKQQPPTLYIKHSTFKGKSMNLHVPPCYLYRKRQNNPIRNHIKSRFFKEYLKHFFSTKY